jgi:signal transduction histidine kinase
MTPHSNWRRFTKLRAPSLFRLYLFTTLGIVFSVAIASVSYFLLVAPDPEWIETDMVLFTRALGSMADNNDLETARINASKIAQLNTVSASVKHEASEVHYAIYRDGKVFIESSEVPAGLFALIATNPPSKAVKINQWYLYGFKRPNTQTVSVLAIKQSYAQRLIRSAVLSGLPFALTIYAVFAGLTAMIGSYFALRPINNLATKIATLNTAQFEHLNIEPKFQELNPVVNALNKRTDELRTQLESERVFFSSAAHELRTPLAVIQAQAHSVAKAKTDQDRNERIKSLQNGVDRAARALGRMLQLARLDSSASAAFATKLDLSEIAGECVAFHAPRAIANQQMISLEADNPVSVLAERSDLVTILDNLIENAINYAGRGANIVVRIGAEQTGKPFLSVEDDGPGFSAEDHATVFERFRRGSQSESSDGSGLGLAIVKSAASRWSAQTSVRKPNSKNGLLISVVFPEC